MNVLLRPRRASVKARPTQIQIPIRLQAEIGITWIKSKHDGRTRKVSDASARDGLNTLKIEIPETRYLEEPLLVITKDGDWYYQVESGTKDEGVILFKYLQDGIETGKTQITCRHKPLQSTWWQIVDVMPVAIKIPMEFNTSKRDGYVYIITNPRWPEAIKIGQALDYERRLNGFQTGDPYRQYKLEWVKHFVDRAKAEKYVHKLLAHKKLDGEWFSLSVEEAIQAIDSITNEMIIN